jgi:hypothetical protein
MWIAIKHMPNVCTVVRDGKYNERSQAAYALCVHARSLMLCVCVCVCRWSVIALLRMIIKLLTL